MEVKIVKEVKRSDGLWRFACGDVLEFCSKVRPRPAFGPQDVLRIANAARSKEKSFLTIDNYCNSPSSNIKRGRQCLCWGLQNLQCRWRWPDTANRFKILHVVSCEICVLTIMTVIWFMNPKQFFKQCKALLSKVHWFLFPFDMKARTHLLTLTYNGFTKYVMSSYFILSPRQFFENASTHICLTFENSQ